jgi:hypothetical protein
VNEFVYLKTNGTQSEVESHINTKNNYSEHVHTESDDENDSNNKNNSSDDHKR